MGLLLLRKVLDVKGHIPKEKKKTLSELIILQIKGILKEGNRGSIQLAEKSTYITISRVLTKLLITKGEWNGILESDTDTFRASIVDQEHIEW